MDFSQVPTITIRAVEEDYSQVPTTITKAAVYLAILAITTTPVVEDYSAAQITTTITIMVEVSTAITTIRPSSLVMAFSSSRALLSAVTQAAGVDYSRAQITIITMETISSLQISQESDLVVASLGTLPALCTIPTS